MYLLLAILILGIFLALYKAYHEDRQPRLHYVLQFIYYPLISAPMSLVAWMFLSFFLSLFYDGKYSEKITHNLISFGDGQNVSGNFVIGCGSIDDKMVYTYYRYSGDKDSSIVRRSISADLTKIYEHDSIKHARIVIDRVSEKQGGNWIVIPHNVGYQKYRIYLPKNSIIREINLDNK